MDAAAQQQQKQAVAEAAARLVPDGIRLGLGSGSTLELFTLALASRSAQGLKVECVPTSTRIAALAQKHGLTLGELGSTPLDLAIDGADEVDPQGRLIKGAGGAMVRERIVAAAAPRFLVLVDESKLVTRLGERMPLPIEIQQFGCGQTERRLAELMGSIKIRLRNGARFISDNGGYVVDCPLPSGKTPEALLLELRAIPGVVDTGFFLGMASEALVARGGSVVDKLMF